MPRQNSITSADSTIRCPYCRGMGQVVNVSEEPDASSLIACPLCEGLGRVIPGGGNRDALKIYQARKAIKEKNKQ